jgi:peptide/nickel transport system ATP-binding protein
MTAPLLQLDNFQVDVSTRQGAASVVTGISLEVQKGEAVGIVGESGCGKSLTMLGVVGLLPAAARVSGGKAVFDGKDLGSLKPRELRAIRGHKIGFVFQDPMTSFNPVTTIGEQLSEPLIYHLGLSKADALKRAGELMRLVGIPGGESRLKDFPHQFSGGMRQRIMIAMGLACEPQLLIADEPTTALDVTVQAQIVDLVNDLRKRSDMAVVWITHDLALLSNLADRIFVLYAGMVVESGPVATIVNQPKHPYTQGLIASLPQLDGELRRRLSAIPGAPPDISNRPRGCPFSPRCTSRIDRCLSEMPPLEAVDGPDHVAACWVTPRTDGAAHA